MKISGLELRQLETELDQLLSPLWLERSRRGLPGDADSLARERSTLENRLIIGFDEIDLDAMPSYWCWKRAALSLAGYLVEQMILELDEGRQSYFH